MQAHAADFVLVDVDSAVLQRGVTARETWRLNGFSSYAFTLRSRCYCDLIPAARVYVWDGEVAKIVDLATNESFSGPKAVKKYPTINSLFDLIDSRLSQYPDRVQIEHDRYVGYPTRIFIDPSRQMADDDFDYRITDFFFLER